MERWNVRVELDGDGPAQLSVAVLDHLTDELGHLRPKVSTSRGHVLLDLNVIGPSEGNAFSYAHHRVGQALIGAGLADWDATIVDIRADSD